MKVLIACEFSGKVRDAFLAKGIDAVSCDLLPTDNPGPHIQDDVELFLNCAFDMLIAFPPCTHLASSGARWFKDKQAEQKHALRFVQVLMDAPIDRIAIENPIGVISTRIRKPDQIIQPWQFGHGETKATCLWLKGLPKLQPTDVVNGREARIHRMPPSQDRWKKRSETFTGIASAMADQWGIK
jgi:site-specific DNA-cytosine methylase